MNIYYVRIMYESMQWTVASRSETHLSFAFLVCLFLQFLLEEHPSSLHGLHPFRGIRGSLV